MSEVTIANVVSGTVGTSFSDEEFNEYKYKLIKEFEKDDKKFNNLKYYFDIFIEIDLEEMNKDSINFYVKRSKDTLLSHITKSLEKHLEFTNYRRLSKLISVSRLYNKADICLRTYIVIF